MPSLTGELKLRPIRIGFLVRPSDLSNLRKVFQICSCMWGGMYNPIIPVSRTRPAAWRQHHCNRPSGHQLARGYIRFFEPDVFVETETGLAQSVGIADKARRWLHPRVIALDDIVRTGNNQNPEFVFGLDIIDVYKEIYQTEFRFVPRRNSFVALFHDRSRHGAYVDATFGGFPQEEAISHIHQSYEHIFEPTNLKHHPSAWLRIVKEHGRTALTFTNHALKSMSYTGWSPTIFVANPTSPIDLLDLWNLRLIRRNVLSVNSEWIPDLREYLHDFIDRNHRPLPGNPHGVMGHTEVEIGNSFSKEEALNLVGDTFADLPKHSWSLKLWYDRIWDNNNSDHVQHPSPMQIHTESSRLDLAVSEGRTPTIQFRSLAPDFASDYGSSNARWVNVISLTDRQDQHQFALALPSSSTAFSDYHLRIGGPLLISREGFVLLQQYKHQQEYIELIPRTKAVVEHFKRHGIDATASDSGRVADQILSSIEGFWGVAILQDKKTLQLLDKMSKSVRRRAEGTIEEYAERTASVKEWQSVVKSRRENNSGPKDYLERLVEAGALKLGLAVPCPNCQKENWYGLVDLAEQVLCERCLNSFCFPQGSLNFKNTPWKYRVAGPYSVPNYANGSYATVLALNCLVSGTGFSNNTITLSTSLDLKVGEKQLEVDFACWYQRERIGSRRDEPLFLVGEAKSFAKNSFSEEDIHRLKVVGEKMPGTFLVLATLKSELSGAERGRIEHLTKWGRFPRDSGQTRNPVIVLTSTELFAHHGIEEAWRKTNDKRNTLIQSGPVRVDNLHTLADLTQQAYLELQPTDEWLFEYRKRRYERRSHLKTSNSS